MKNKNLIAYVFCIVLAFVSLTSCKEEIILEPIFIGAVAGDLPLFNVSFSYFEESSHAKAFGDTMFVVITNDTLLTCQTNKGKVFFMRRLNNER